MNYHESLQNLGYVNYPIFFSYTYANYDDFNKREAVEDDAQEDLVQELAEVNSEVNEIENNAENEVANEIDTEFDAIEVSAFDQDEYSRLESTVSSAQKKATIDLIAKSVGNELEDEAFYSFLISHAPNDEQRKIIISIRDDERKHNKLLRQLYFDLTGKKLPQDVLTKIPTFNMSYMQGLEKALMGELQAVTRYQQVLKGLTNMNYHNTILEILTDELRHADKYNFLITKNSL